MQKGASFNLEAVKAKIEAAMDARWRSSNGTSLANAWRQCAAL